MAEKTPPKFRKTKTEKWAVMAPVDDLEKALAEGGKIEVLKKSGDWSSFTVGSLGKPFDVDGEMMCYGYAPGDEADPSKASGANRSSNGGGEPAGGPAHDPLADKDLAQPITDASEPMPEYQGGAEDEWAEF